MAYFNRKINGNTNRIMVPYIWIWSLFATFVLFFLLYILYDSTVNNEWPKLISFIAVGMMAFQLFMLKKAGRNFFSFEIWFTIFSYLFMFGQIFLVGLLGIDEITALGHDRSVFDPRYSAETMYHAAIFVLACIQIMVTFFLTCQIKRNDEESCCPEIFYVAVIMIIIGLPCHLIYSGRMIILAQTFSSYDAIVDQSGLIDDFANFFIYGLICLIFSRKINWQRMKIIIFVVICYLVLVMGLTGDRRYQIVSILVLLLSAFKAKKIRFSWKYLMLGIAGYFFLTLFYVLREIRTDSLVSLTQLINLYIDTFESKNNILIQTLYEFGSSFYTVCLAFKYMPDTLSFKYGLTIISGIVSIIPLGFLYSNSKIFTAGRLASELMGLGATTVGASIYADFYGNFGFVGGIVCAACLGLIVGKLFYIEKTNFSNDYYDARYFILFYALIHLARASFTEVIRTTTWGLLVLFILRVLFMRRAR